MLRCFPRELGKHSGVLLEWAEAFNIQQVPSCIPAEVSSPEGNVSEPKAPGEVDFVWTSKQHISQHEHWDDRQQARLGSVYIKAGSPACLSHVGCAQGTFVPR